MNKICEQNRLTSPLLEQHKEHTQTRDASLRDVAKSCKINNCRNSSIARAHTHRGLDQSLATLLSFRATPIPAMDRNASFQWRSSHGPPNSLQTCDSFSSPQPMHLLLVNRSSIMLQKKFVTVQCKIPNETDDLHTPKYFENATSFITISS